MQGSALFIPPLLNSEGWVNSPRWLEVAFSRYHLGWSHGKPAISSRCYISPSTTGSRSSDLLLLIFHLISVFFDWARVCLLLVFKNYFWSVVIISYYLLPDSRSASLTILYLPLFKILGVIAGV